MGDSDDLAADVVVEPVDAVGVDEAVPDPQTSLHGLVHLPQNIERILYAVLCYLR